MSPILVGGPVEDWMKATNLLDSKLLVRLDFDLSSLLECLLLDEGDLLALVWVDDVVQAGPGRASRQLRRSSSCICHVSEPSSSSR